MPDWGTMFTVFVIVVLVDVFLGDYIKDVFGKGKSKGEVYSKFESIEKQLTEIQEELKKLNNK